ncbi:MAG: hydantoinase B/oxoprolinase family protein, partial [Chloroflexota bacterium]
QTTHFSHLGQEKWSISGMIDRTKFAAQGLHGGQEGAMGEFMHNGEMAPPKTVMWMDSADTITISPPGGGGYGDPLTRDTQHVLQDVIEGYVSIEAAAEIYKVAIHYSGNPDNLVRLPKQYEIDEVKTAVLRKNRN